MRINGVYANNDAGSFQYTPKSSDTDPDYDGAFSGFSAPTYTTSFSMDFSGTGVAIPFRNNARVAAGLSPNGSAVRMANLQIWCGQYIDWMNPGAYSTVVIIRDGKGYPAPLSMAGAAFGTPTVRMSGNHLLFPNNTGTGGAFTKEGTITDFTPTPSY